MNITFRLGSHTIRGQAVQMVEVWRDSIFVAAIYPHNAGLHVVTKYLEDVAQFKGYPPSVLIKLKGG